MALIEAVLFVNYYKMVFDIWAVLRPEELDDPDGFWEYPDDIGWVIIGRYDPVSDEVSLIRHW